MSKSIRRVNFLGTLAVAAATTVFAAAALAQDVTVTNTPADPVYNQPQKDTWPVVVTTWGAFPSGKRFIDIPIPDLAVPEGYRLIVDFVSVDTSEAGGKRMWANFRSCEGVKPLGWGKIAIPLSYGGSLFGDDANWLGNVAMHTYLDAGCNAIVQVARETSNATSHAHVTLQGHMVKVSRLEPPTVGRN